MSTLYVIGNGFDLHHGLSTSLAGFRQYSEYSEFHRLYENGVFMISAEKTLEEHWSYLEENLANLDVDELIESKKEYYDDDPHENQFIYEVKNAIDVLTKGLKNGLSKYLSLADIQPIEQTKMLRIDTNARFLSFNYTSTLERFYNISPENICYIHGKLNSSDSPIVVGHGMKSSDYDYVSPNDIDISAYSEEAKEAYFDVYSPDYEYAVSEAYRYFSKSYKDTDACIKSSGTFLESLSDVNKVIILGHSLADIDQPYFNYINTIVRPNCQWWASFYPDSFRDETLDQLEGIVGDINRINVFKIAQLAY